MTKGLLMKKPLIVKINGFIFKINAIFCCRGDRKYPLLPLLMY